MTTSSDVYRPENSVSIYDFGGCGDGKFDNSSAFASAFESGAPIIYVPRGEYIISSTLFIDSDTELLLHPHAKLMLAPGSMKKRGDFFITNKHHRTGDKNIKIRGGYFDANGFYNPKGELFDKNGYSGTAFNFCNVDGLSVCDVFLMNPAGYFTRNCRVKNFEYRNIVFSSFYNISNNDGIHLGGYCENGVISELRAQTDGTTSDDMIALNADDCLTRVENLDMECGYIKNIKITDITAINCHTFIRMLSVDSEISNINASHIAGGCSEMAINLDGARYCRTPLIPQDDERFHGGTGNIFDIQISDMEVISTRRHDGALIRIETNTDNFIISNFKRPEPEMPEETECSANRTKTLIMTNVSSSEICIDDITKNQLKKIIRDSKLSNKGIKESPRGGISCDCLIKPNDSLILEDGGAGNITIKKAEY